MPKHPMEQGMQGRAAARPKAKLGPRPQRGRPAGRPYHPDFHACGCAKGPWITVAKPRPSAFSEHVRTNLQGRPWSLYIFTFVPPGSSRFVSRRDIMNLARHFSAGIAGHEMRTSPVGPEKKLKNSDIDPQPARNFSFRRRTPSEAIIPRPEYLHAPIIDQSGPLSRLFGLFLPNPHAVMLTTASCFLQLRRIHWQTL